MDQQDMHAFQTQHDTKLNQSPVRSKQNITVDQPLLIQTSCPIYVITLSPDGNYVASAGGDEYHHSYDYKKSKYIASPGDHNFIQIWDLKTGNQVGENFEGHIQYIYQIHYSKSGRFIVSTSQDNTIRQWDVLTQKQIGETIIGNDIYFPDAEYTFDEKYIISCCDDSIRVWNPQTGQEYIDKRMEWSHITCQALSPIQSHVVFGDWEGSIRVKDYEQPHLTIPSKMDHFKKASSIKYSNDGKLIITACAFYEDEVKVWDGQYQKLLLSIEHKAPIDRVWFSADIKYIIIGVVENQIKVYDRLTGKQIGETLEPYYLNGTLFTLNSKYLITHDGVTQLKVMVSPIEL